MREAPPSPVGAAADRRTGAAPPPEPATGGTGPGPPVDAWGAASRCTGGLPPEVRGPGAAGDGPLAAGRTGAAGLGVPVPAPVPVVEAEAEADPVPEEPDAPGAVSRWADGVREARWTTGGRPASGVPDIGAPSRERRGGGVAPEGPADPEEPVAPEDEDEDEEADGAGEAGGTAGPALGAPSGVVRPPGPRGAALR
ncbi:hypothetical protein ACIQ7D_06380 [Streptomyces sp. NPDC096310]|uniref:hypothetical protein n=1 Tax=Streptomyces sp. NPDC096310 TaxID=3366082 RepID=UPI0037F32A9D